MSSNWNIKFWEYEFFAPHWLWLLCLVPIVFVVIYFLEKNRKGELKYSRSSSDQHAIGSSWINRLREGLLLIYVTIPTLMIFALAKPYHWAHHDDFNKRYKEGIDIVITMDVSVSMLAQDFLPNRLEASKKVAKEFIDGRKGDRIGLVAFAGEAFTACPPTLDYTVLKNQIDGINGERIEGGTAIGIGLGTAVTRLRSDSLSSKVIILLTDGSDNGTEMSPETAANLAKAKNIRVYTIGMGSNGLAPMPVLTPFGMHMQTMPVEIDEVTLMKIAQKTGGKYFRATDEKSLKTIYTEIEKLEKRKMEDQQFKSEPPSNPQAFLNWALVFLIIAWGVNVFMFRANE
jgi:Ca-activated chloride channel homolog